MTCVPDQKTPAYYSDRKEFLKWHLNADQLVLRESDGEIRCAVYFFHPGMRDIELKAMIRAFRVAFEGEVKP